MAITEIIWNWNYGKKNTTVKYKYVNSNKINKYLKQTHYIAEINNSRGYKGGESQWYQNVSCVVHTLSLWHKKLVQQCHGITLLF